MSDKQPGQAYLLKDEIMANYQERAVLEHGDLVVRIPVNEQHVGAFLEHMKSMVRVLGQAISEPVAIRTDVTPQRGHVIEVLTLGPVDKVLHGLAAAALGHAAILDTRPALWQAGPLCWSMQYMEATLAEPTAAKYSGEEEQSMYEEAPRMPPDLPDQFEMLPVGDKVSLGCLMLTDKGWEPVTAPHIGREIEPGEQYAQRRLD